MPTGDPATYAVGIDVGTGSVKGAVIAPDGRRWSVASAPYGTATPAPGWTEQDPDDWWIAVGDVLGQLVTLLPDLGGARTTVGLTGQMHTTVLRDADGVLLRPAILWSDQRAVLEAERLDAEVAGIADLTGNHVKPAFTSAHVFWVSAHEPAVLGRVASVAVPKDDIRRRLGAGWATEPSDASATGLFHGRTDSWAPQILDRVGIGQATLPPVLPSEGVTGVVSALPPSSVPLEALLGSPVIGGAGDQAAQAIALGVVAPGDIALSLGTSGAALGVSRTPVFGSFRHAISDSWLRLNSTHSAGLAMTWLARVTSAELRTLVADAAESHEPPFFLPYLQGHRESMGPPAAFVGLDVSHGPADLARAAMEGVAFALDDLARSIGFDDDRPSVVHLGGGGWRSELWRQLMADTLGVPVRYEDRDSAFGAAALAARSAGWFGEFEARNADPAVVATPSVQGQETARRRRHRFDAITRALESVE